MEDHQGKPRTAKELKHVWIGADRREASAFHVACHSLGESARRVSVHVHSIDRAELAERGLYRRPTNFAGGVLWDVISDSPMATDHAVARFMVPYLARRRGARWVLFTDGDVLFRDDIAKLFELADKRYAVMCVKHAYELTENQKMDGQPQVPYPRKNWSSVMLFNTEHPANEKLTVHMVNTLPGRDLHRFCWLEDDQIGALPARWNHLIGVHPHDPDAAIAHFTNGVPDMPGYEACPFADEWRASLAAARERFKTYT